MMFVILSLVFLSAIMGWLVAYMYLDSKYHVQLLDLKDENEELRDGLLAIPPRIEDVYILGVVKPPDSDGLREQEIVRTFSTLEAVHVFTATLPDPLKNSWFLMKHHLH